MLYLLALLLVAFHWWAIAGAVVVGCIALGDDSNVRSVLFFILAFCILLIGASIGH